MAVPFDTPVSAIEGVGPAAGQLLQAGGIYTVYDLLRAGSPAIHSAVAALASLQEVKAWRQMAVLLEVATVTPQWAEALVQAGVTSLVELRHLDLNELQTLFNAARDQGTIPSLPALEDMVAMLADASLLDYAGAITGTVKDRDENPVNAALVDAGNRQVITDGRGRFRILRIRLGSLVNLHIEKAGFQTTTRSMLPLPTATVRVVQLILPPQVTLRPRPAVSTVGNLSELNGDEMPPMQGQPVTSGQVPVAALQSGDLLVLTEFYSNQREVKLVSKLLEFDGTRFVVRWSRLPKSDLPAEALIGDHFLKTTRGFRKIKMNPRKLNDYKKLRKMQLRTGYHPRTVSLDGLYQQAAETFVRMGARPS